MPKALSLTLLVMLAGAALIYAGVLALLWWQQEKLLFFPQPLPASHVLATAPDLHELTVRVDGAELSVLQLRLPQPRAVVIFLHGNGGNLAGWSSGIDAWRRANVDVVMPDYRGYGKSTGAISSAAQLGADVRAVWNAFADEYRGKPLVVYGRSLGTALAAGLARDLAREGRPAALTVLVSPYVSLRELTAQFYPWVPGALLRYPLDTASALRELPGPVLLLHGEADTLIGADHARRLQQVLPSARLVVVPGAGHNDLQEFPAYQQALREALEQL